MSLPHLGPGGRTEFPLLLGCFTCGSFNRTAQELTKFLLQRLDLFLEIDGFTELLRCNVYHGGMNVEGFAVDVSIGVLNRRSLHDLQAYSVYEVKTFMVPAQRSGFMWVNTSWSGN